MTRRHVITIARILAAGLLAACAVTAASAESAAPSAADGDDRAWERYEAIVDNNIFLKDRRAPRSADDERPGERPVYRVERDLLLTGIGRQGDRFTAFVEDLRSGATQRLVTGDDVGDGRNDAIALDHLVYVEGDSRLRIEIGQTLAGDGGSTASNGGPSAEPAGTSTAPGTSGLDPEDEQAILERLRQQRKKELNPQ